MTKVQKAVDLFLTGESFSEGELATRLNTTRTGARGVVHSLRSKGYSVYLNNGTLDERGRRRVSKYRLGTPTRAAFATAFAVAGRSVLA